MIELLLDINNVGRLRFGTSTMREATQEQAVEETLSTLECIAKQMAMETSKLGNPPRIHAAAIFLQAQQEQYSGFKDVDIIGAVALLGTIKDEDLNRSALDIQNYIMLVALINWR